MLVEGKGERGERLTTTHEFSYCDEYFSSAHHLAAWLMVNMIEGG